MRKIKKDTLLGYLPILPFLAVVVCYELLPLAQLVMSSLIGKTSGTFGFENFIKVFTTPLYQASILNSVKISIFQHLLGWWSLFWRLVPVMNVVRYGAAGLPCCSI